MAPYWSEDVAALADLAAGAYCQMSGHLPASFREETLQVLTSSDIASKRARAIGNWLASGPNNLKHILLRLEQDNVGDVRASAQAFVDIGLR